MVVPSPAWMVDRASRIVPDADPGLGYPTRETPWGIGPALPIISMYVTGIRRVGAWPETMMVLDAFWENFPDRRFVLMVSI